ncbi:MAG: segregation/condensation protein A [Gammaproteobacteria bacterium]|nr:segregation/condensation protein A [Gammaproteobacteria bacterium]
MISDDNQTSNTGQSEMPFAIVQGAPITELPHDLYIPPEALEVFLEAFEGPLDLLLYLIRKQNLDILDIPIADITAQYMKYIELMEVLQLELAGEYLVMGAVLAEIKSRMLLPRIETEDDEDDPRAELIKRLQEYERYKQAAEDIDTIPRLEREVFNTVIDFNERRSNQKPPQVEMDQILHAFADVLARAEMYAHHMIHREALSVRERMTIVLDRLRGDEFIDFLDLFAVEEGKAGVIVSLLAILELTKESLVEIVQNENNGPIYLKAAA